MRVKKIELIGFKSFADRTEIHLNSGVTAIVGPNGCGKSNISDAIRWVFGERSAKLLRGTKMEDVIFAGTELRKPLGLAEVSLTIDNQDHILPIEYDEVTLTRRMDRSGQSQYLINRTACRLKDILDLILDTGMGSNSYSMIEQGRVDSVINADPEERRFLIEEAAGISKYKVKKEEALRKLERTEQNLLRIRDIVTEVQKNIQYAERQAKRAERYKTQFDDLKGLEIKKAFWELDELRTQKNSEELRQRELAEAQSLLQSELREILENEAQQKRLLEEILQKESAESVRYFELKSELSRLVQKREFNRERLRACEHRQIEIQKEQELLAVQLAGLEKELQNQAVQRESSKEEQAGSVEALGVEKKSFEREEVKFSQIREDLGKLKSLLFNQASELAHTKNESHRLQTLLDRLEHEELKRRQALEKLRKERGALEARRLSFQEELAQGGERADTKESEAEVVSRLLVQTQKEIEELQENIEGKRFRLQEVNSRIQLLEELQESAEESQRKILASVAKSPLQGKLIKGLQEVLQVKSGYEAAVEAVLGAFAQALVAEDVETAKGLMREMSESHAGPCAIFVQRVIRPQALASRRPSISHPQVSQSLEQVVKVQDEFKSIFIPLFENVYVIENFLPERLEEFLTLAQDIKLVTRQGILFGPDSRIFFRNGRLSSDQGPFRRTAEIEELSQSRRTFNAEIESLETQKAEQERERDNLANKMKVFEEKNRDLSVKKEAAETFLQGLQERMASLDEEIKVLEIDQTESRQESARVKSQLSQITSQILESESQELQLRDQQKDLEKALGQLQSIRETQIHSLSRLKTLLENHESQFRAMDVGWQLILNQIETARVRTKKLSEEKQETEKHAEMIQEEEVFLKEKQEVVSEEQKSLETTLSEIRGRKAFQEERHQEFSRRAREVESKARTLTDSLHQEEMKAMEFSYRQKNIFERMEQIYHVKLADLLPEEFKETALDIAQLDSDIHALKSKVEAFGPVNLLAVEEYDELRQRFDFLSAQEKDLAQARESLLEAIRKINRTTKTLFAVTFIKAQALFQEYYQTLFNGGHAELILVPNEQEQEEEGVDIMVRPPGKKLQHISLLSGGEKALTAVAMLFALFKIRPSPLCVLDEVDAPLDEANVDRFLKVLRTFLESTQFLIVTHNRKTIAMGDFLYGVTMEEPGVSKLVSVKVAPPAEKENAVAQSHHAF